MDNLETLRDAMISNDPRIMDRRHNQWSTSLPTFGGGEVYGGCIWSWDETRLLVGTCGDDLEIVTREEWTDG